MFWVNVWVNPGGSLCKSTLKWLEIQGFFLTAYASPSYLCSITWLQRTRDKVDLHMIAAWANQFLGNPQPAQAYKTTPHPACNVCKQWSHLLYVRGESFKFQGIPLPFQGAQEPQFKLFRLLLPAMVQASWAPLVVKGRPSRQRLRATMRFQGCQMMRVLKEVNLIFFPHVFFVLLPWF